jgi:small subunit ribosomal protein S1
MTQIKKTTGIENFDWASVEKYEARRKRIPNPQILEKYGEKIYSHEPYALDMYEAVFLNKEISSKEVHPGEIRKIIDVLSVNGSEVGVILEGMIDCILDIKSEKIFAAKLGISVDELSQGLKEESGKQSFIHGGYHVTIESNKPYLRGSISRGEIDKLRGEFFAEISTPRSAYFGKITEKNGGGFIINVHGVKGFLPGSLAATNIVRDFDAMIGKELPVVVEDYLKESDTFVFSYKKYVSMVLPSKIEELDLERTFTGTVTGVTKFGIFVEFDDIFTGLLHTSKMSEECKEKFNSRGFKPGDVFDKFWIKEVTADKKLILTDEDPSIRRQEMEDFRTKNVGTIQGGEVVAVQPFGTLVKLQKDICGLISQKEIKNKKKNLTVGDTVMVSIDRVQNDKVFLSLPAEG